MRREKKGRFYFLETLLRNNESRPFYFDTILAPLPQRVNRSGEAAKDESGLSGSQSLLPAGHLYSPVSPGLYYLAIGWWDNEPFSSTGRIFAATNPTGTNGPDFGAGGADPIASWNNYVLGRIDLSTNYQIELTGATGVPEPGTLLLVVSGLFGMFGYKLRRRRTSGPPRT